MHTKNTTKQFMHTDYSCSGWVSIFIPWSATQWIIQMFFDLWKNNSFKDLPMYPLGSKKKISSASKLDQIGGVKLKSLFAIMWKWNWNKFWIILVIFFLFRSTFAWGFFLGTWIFNSLWSFSSWFHASSKCCCKIC